MKLFLKYWLVVVVWMVLIFDMSTGVGAPQHSSRILVPILRWFKSNLTYHEIQQANLVVRKCAHLLEYAILAILLCYALRKSSRQQIHGWCWRCAGWAFFLSAAYGLGDEIHQRFVSSRHASIRDVLIDASGAVLGLTILWLCHRAIASTRQEKTAIAPLDPTSIR
ncbi:MAG: hypothetical protein B9S32_00295 [Verrucomicrobia bacterium Tous-C9LFEB]|nr:MAG: hypothetical protein B9S32_00295 [Verrucomicrobia bacterium Tous-C9LFEB]